VIRGKLVKTGFKEKWFASLKLHVIRVEGYR
jgi:hypothetical protein